MKRALLFLLCAVMSVQIFSTVDISAELFPTLAGLQRTTCLKNINENEVGTVWGSNSYLMQEIETTTIDGKQYLLFGTNNTYDEYWSLWLREENNKILVYSAAQKKDLVLYDFTLNVGDSLPRLYVDEELSSIVDYFKYEADWEYTKPLFVTEVSTITLLDGKEYKKWTFDNGIEYVEGIGSFGTSYAWNDFYQLIANGPLYSDVFSQHLVCISRNGQLLYQMDDAEMEQLETECLCEYNTEQKPEDLFPTLWGLQRTACSEYTDCQENETYLMQADEIKEINGKQYLKYGGVFLREEDSKVLIYSFPYEKDFVLYDWTLEIGDTLQILGIDPFSFPELEYTAVVDYVAFEEYDANGNRTIVKKPLGNKRVKDISTMRLLDGNEYKAWLFGYDWERGNYYVEGIGNASKYGGDYVDLVYPFEVPGCYYGERLVCVSRDGVLLYQIDDAEMERLGTDCLCDGYQSSYKDQWCDTWNVLYHGWDPEGGDDPYMPYTFIYQLEEDTTINDLTYQRLTGRFSLSTMPSNKEYVAALRFAENKKVFVHYDNTEYLLYDFGAQVGDTLEIFGGIDHYKDFKTLTHVITEIDSLDDGRLQIYSNAIIQESEGYETPFERLYPKIWIEGVGSKDGIVQNSATNRIGIGPCVLLCAYHNDDCIYTTDNPYYTPYGCVHNDSFFTATEEVNAPTQSAQKIMYNGQLLILRDSKTYNIMGMEVTK